MQIFTIPAGHNIQVEIAFTQAPLAQWWQIGDWGMRDGVQLPIPGGWTPPPSPGTPPDYPWQLIYEDQTHFGDAVTSRPLNWVAHNHQLTLTFQAWANKGWDYVDLDSIDSINQNHVKIVFDRTQDSNNTQPDYSRHFKDGWIDASFTPPLNVPPTTNFTINPHFVWKM